MERRGVLARLAAMWPGGAPGAPPATNGFRGDIMIGAKLKIALLYDLWNEDPVAAAGKEEAAAAPAPKRRKEEKEGKKRKDRPRGDLRRATEDGARAFVFRVGWEAAVPALALPFGCRPHFQPDRVIRRRRYQGNERGRLCRPAGIALHGRWPAFHFHVPGQSDCQEDIRVSRHQDSILRDCLSRAH